MTDRRFKIRYKDPSWWQIGGSALIVGTTYIGPDRSGVRLIFPLSCTALVVVLVVVKIIRERTKRQEPGSPDRE